jgi:hypothetical protein
MYVITKKGEHLISCAFFLTLMQHEFAECWFGLQGHFFPCFHVQHLLILFYATIHLYQLTLTSRSFT